MYNFFISHTLYTLPFHLLFSRTDLSAAGMPILSKQLANYGVSAFHMSRVHRVLCSQGDWSLMRLEQNWKIEACLVKVSA